MSQDAVTLQGEWTIHAAATLRETMLAHVAAGASAFDLQGITEMDSAGLQLLLATQRSLACSGLAMSLHHPSPAVAEVMRQYGLDLELTALSEHMEAA